MELKIEFDLKSGIQIPSLDLKMDLDLKFEIQNRIEFWILKWNLICSLRSRVELDSGSYNRFGSET